jgi:hypothetical protein
MAALSLPDSIFPTLNRNGIWNGEMGNITTVQKLLAMEKSVWVF